jgi:hypothetical protein
MRGLRERARPNLVKPRDLEAGPVDDQIAAGNRLPDSQGAREVNLALIAYLANEAAGFAKRVTEVDFRTERPAAQHCIKGQSRERRQHAAVANDAARAQNAACDRIANDSGASVFRRVRNGGQIPLDIEQLREYGSSDRKLPTADPQERRPRLL